MCFTEEDIKHMSKVQWKKFIHETISETAFEYLKEKNLSKSKTKHILF